ncbi:MAG: hypothetical protein MI867_17775 [Pseudomonadales bacterium]|nr:hypothetical protein [Pseudomonadales bacterium]
MTSFVQRFYILNVFIAFMLLIATKLWPESRILLKATIENGPYEVATALILLFGGIALIIKAIANKAPKNLLTLAQVSLGFLCIVGAGEEISWGQHWLQFESSDFFQQHNQQQETNLHNLMDPVLFSTLINIVIYGGFTLIPFLHWAFPNNPMSQKLQEKKLLTFMPGIRVAIFLMLANCFHGWLIPATYSDSIVLICCWLLGCCVMFRQRTRVESFDWFAMGFCIAGFVICLLVADIFKHANLQYEIRECFTAFVIVVWALGWKELDQPAIPQSDP